VPHVTNNPAISTTSDGGGGNSIWYSPANAEELDYNYASSLVGAPGVTNPLVLAPNGMGLPAGAVVTGIELTIDRYCASALSSDLSVKVTLNDGTQSRELASAAAWPTTLTPASYGGASDRLGFDPSLLTAANINGGGFGASLSVQVASGVEGGSDTAFVDQMTITVFYAGGSVSSSFLLAHL
jgi:hypothetical protein